MNLVWQSNKLRTASPLFRAIRRAGALALCSLTAHGAVHAETPQTAAQAVAGGGPNTILIPYSGPDPLGNAAPDIRLAALPAQEPVAPRRWTDHIPADQSRYRSFGSKLGQIKWEMVGLIGYFTAINSPKLFKPTTSFHFKDEGWFGKSTTNLGVDKLTHAFDAYLVAEFLHARLHRKTGATSGDALTAAALASGLMIYSELSDGIETDSGFSVQDVAMNTAGAAFSVLRNTVPGLKEKLDFRLLLMPNSDVYTRTGKRHYAQQRYLFALQLSGFERFEETPLRFVELHAGYYASGFTGRAIARGERPQRHLFFGVGLNVRELFFKDPGSRVGRIAGQALDYVQIPYTAAHWD